MTKYSIIKDSDSYKYSHWRLYPAGTTEMYSYLESRGGVYDKTVFFGLQPILEKMKRKITVKQVEEGKIFAAKHGVPFNYEGWMYIATELNGKLPIEIKAVKEGTIVPFRNVLLTIRNTDPKCAWLTSFLETMLLRIWYSITVATRIHNMKKNIKPFFERTADTMDGIGFAVLDFSSRGVSSYEQSEIGGAAYLASFVGSDNIPAVDFVNKHYVSDMAGWSVSATEHSVMCSYGEDNEFESFKNLIENGMDESGILSVVSDTWDIFRAAGYWAQLADMIKAKNGTLVVRPDSGDIEDVLPKVLEILEEGFGYTMNSKGFKVLNNVKVLWGDGINEHTCTLPFEIAERMGISADSVLTGSGGGLMQVDINRDTNKFAVKGSNVIVNGVSTAIAKDPVTDKGKQSKKGKFALLYSPKLGFDTVNPETCKVNGMPADESGHDMLEQVFLNGKIVRRQTIDEIRNEIDRWADMPM